MTGAYIRFW